MRDVDVFYIHPTTYRSMQSWNQDVADKATNDWTDGSVIARQASVFNACCRVFAPRYRQASMLAVRDRLLEADGGKAYALAYSDIERAFESYLRRQNRGRPFIIAGHSQGALMAYWLLRDHVDSRPLQDRMVAAYLVGVDLVEGDFGRTFRSLRPCEASTATGCVIAWNAVNTAMDIRAMKGVAGGRFARTHGVREGLDLVCINPLTFDMARPEADRGAAQGAVVGVPDASPIGPLQRGAVSAACRDGWLVVDVDPALGLTPLPGGSMHYHDYGLFYQDIRTNVRDRIAAFKRR